jgi:hypothetical protein
MVMDGRDEKGKFIEGHKSTGRRPKGALSINDELRKLLATKDKKTGKKYIESLALKIFTEALKGNDRLLVEMWQQMEGRAKQQIDVDMDMNNSEFNIIIKPASEAMGVRVDNDPIEDEK